MTLVNENFQYTVVVKADVTTTMVELRDKAIRQIKRKYHKDVPKDQPMDLRFEKVERANT